MCDQKIRDRTSHNAFTMFCFPQAMQEKEKEKALL